MLELGVDIIRLSPRSQDMEKVMNAYYNKTNNVSDGADYAIAENCNGYWHGEPGMLQH